MNIFAHNTTTIRNLAEIRHRENIPPVETQYEPPAPMCSVAPDPVSPEGVRKVLADIKDLKKPKPVSPAELFHEKLKGKVPEEPTPISRKPTSWNPFARFAVEDQAASSSSEPPCCPPSEKDAALQPAPSPTPIVEMEPEVVKPGGKSARGTATTQPTKPTDPAAIEQQQPSEKTEGRADKPGTQPSAQTTKPKGREGEKKRTKLGGLFRRSKTSSDEGPTPDVKAASSSIAKLSAEATKAAHDLQRLQGNIPEIKIGEGPISKEEREEAIKRYHAMLEAGGSDALAMLKAAEQFSAIQPIIELPPARLHSLSEDAVLAPKASPERLHSLSIDALIPSSHATTSHTLEHDKATYIIPSMQRAHRLSADATVPVRTAAPGHYLDADPTVNVPQQLFSHELLDDMVVHRQAKSPISHGLDSDKKLSLAQKERQSHGLRSDKQISLAQRQPQSHGLHTDKVLPGKAKPRQHDLHSDHAITSKASARGAHDIAHDVRILSPSGHVRDPHSIGADEIVKESAVFRKSPHPEAMPGHYAGSSSSGDVNDNAMASLNASLQQAGRALGELNRALGASPEQENDAAKMSPTEQGFWGRMFGRKEGPEQGQAQAPGDENTRASQGTQGAQGMPTQ